MKVLDEIYALLKEYNYCNTQADFSRRFLGRTTGHYAYLKSSGNRIDLLSIKFLVSMLYTLTIEVDDSKEFVKRQRLRSAWSGARVMFEGEREIQHVHPAFWCTAVGPLPAFRQPR